MISAVEIKNFRSIADSKIELAPITLLYGVNGTGKSSVLYALPIFKNIAALNPNQPIDSFFNLTFLNLGGFDQVVFDHNTEKNIEFRITSRRDSEEVTYGVSVGKKTSKFTLSVPKKIELSLPVSFPYPAGQKTQGKFEDSIDIAWNGITVELSQAPASPEMIEKAQRVISLLNTPVESLRRVEMVPVKRGFSNPSYSPVPLSSSVYQENEVATLLIADPYSYLIGKILSYCSDIFGKTFSVWTTPGTAISYLQVTDQKGLRTELVNEAFGLNQTIFMLAKVLRKDISTVCIEEPEIHLHPRAQYNLVRAFIRLIKEEGKQIILSTHSEHIVSSFLSEVAKGELKPTDIACYLCEKTEKRTTLKKQEVKPTGQVEGGLRIFMETELELLKEVLGASGKEKKLEDIL